MQELKLSSHKNFVYQTNHNTSSRHLIYVLHGYGQLSRYFIQKFEKANDLYKIVAPEGMHRFYLNGTSGRVGASWMTKENRLDDIEDNIQFLNQLHQNVTEDREFVQITILGFSQGAATAVRWLEKASFSKANLIIWGGVFPPDIEAGELFREKVNRFTFVLGNQDPYFMEETVRKEVLKQYQKLNARIETYDGGHDILYEKFSEII